MSDSLAYRLSQAAAEVPDRVFLRSPSGDLTYAECDDLARRAAAALCGLGVGAGDAVAFLLGNSAEQVAWWAALSDLGALHAPLNPALAGEPLAHALRVSGAGLVVVEDDLASRVGEVASRSGIADLRVVPRSSLQDLCRAARLHPSPRDLSSRAVSPDDLATATLLFTSGTTGSSKACALSHRYLRRAGELHATYVGITEDDVLYCPFPLFHIDAATLTVSAALAARATAALDVRFSASRFWDRVREFDATVFNFMGATLTMLWKQPPTPRDRDHRVRVAWGVPMPEWAAGFEDRFGVALRQVYGLTDAGVPVYDRVVGPRRPGAAGRVIDEYALAIDTVAARVGDPPGVGEILVRGLEPGLVMNGYHGMPEATADTIVDGWVHTGDLGSLDDDGYLTFRGRLSDSVRRRGENISAAEVEQLLESHPAVLEAAVVGVPSPLTEEDVLAYVVLRPGRVVSPASLHRHCVEYGARHLAPRFIVEVDELPRTPTQKVEKHRLRRSAPDPSAWDAENA